MSSWTLNVAKLTKDDNQITLEDPVEDLHVYAGSQIPWPSKSDIRKNFYMSSWILNVADKQNGSNTKPSYVKLNIKRSRARWEVYE